MYEIHALCPPCTSASSASRLVFPKHSVITIPMPTACRIWWVQSVLICHLTDRLCRMCRNAMRPLRRFGLSTPQHQSQTFAGFGYSEAKIRSFVPTLSPLSSFSHQILAPVLTLASAIPLPTPAAFTKGSPHGVVSSEGFVTTRFCEDAALADL